VKGRLLRRALLVLVLAGVGYAVAGLTGALVAGAAVIAGLLPAERPGRSVALGAVVLLAAAAVATILEAPIDGASVSLSFPLEREYAADLGAAAGILLLAAVVTSALAERAEAPAASTSASGGSSPPARALGGWGREALVLVGAFLLRVFAAPAAVPDALGPLIDGVRSGDGLRVVGTDLLAPVPVLLAAFGPGGGRAAAVVAGTAAVGLAMALARRSAPPGVDPDRVAILAGAVAAALPAVWGVGGPEALASAGVVGAVLLARPSLIDPGRAAGAGLLAGLAALARPDALVVLPVLVAWVLVAGRPTRRARRSLAWLGGAAAAVLVPWLLWAHGDTGRWLIAASLGPAPDRWGPIGVAAVVTGVATLVVLVVACTRTFRGRLAVMLPLVALPAWCAAMTLLEGLGHGAPLSWAGPLAAVVVGWQVDVWVRGRSASRPQAPARSSA